MKRVIIGCLSIILMLTTIGCQKKDIVEEPINGVDILRTTSTVKTDSVSGKKLTTQQSYQIGTYITVSIYDDQQVPNEMFDQIFYLIETFDALYSVNRAESEVTAINNNAGISPVEVSDDVFELVKIGIDYGYISKGLFDVSIGPLVELWGIGTDAAHVPTAEDIKNHVTKVDFTKIQLDESAKTVFLTEVGMRLDLGGIAKGHIADELRTFILKSGYHSAIINLGGNVLMVGDKPNGDPWAVGIRDPKGEENVGIIRTDEKSIVSSGVYERYFEENGVRYHHIIHPHKGEPEQNDMLSITVVTDMSVDGDALSTILFLMGLDEGYNWVLTQPDIEAIFVMADGSVYVTPGATTVFTLTNSHYTLRQK